MKQFALALLLLPSVALGQSVKNCGICVSGAAPIALERQAAANVNQEIVALVNAERSRFRLAPLISTPANVAISVASVESMARNSNRTGRVELRHSGQDSVIAWNYQSSAAVVGGWMGSPGHRAILMDPRSRLAGFAMSPSRVGPYWAGTVRR